tara:strand:+ start:192 stop:440 length:249 start_codon:yes stop_codon:yes gene_type:complete
MNILDTYFMVMGGAPPPRPAYAPPPAPVQTPKPSPVENATSAREKTADAKKRGRTSLISNKGGAQGLGGDESSGQKKTLGGY